MQIAFADRILLNKIDLVSSHSQVSSISSSFSTLSSLLPPPSSQLNEIETALKSINSSAQYLRTSFSNVDPVWVLDINSYSLNDLNPLLVKLPPPPTHHCSDDACASCGTENLMTPAPVHSASVLTTYGFSFPGLMDLHALMTLLDKLLYSFDDEGNGSQQHGSSSTDSKNDPSPRSYGRIFRMKGVFHIQDEEYLHLMQAVHDVFDIQPSSFRCRGEDDKTSGLNSVILIGKNLDQDFIEREVKKCITNL
jgi:G3E family GTPase